MTNIVKSSNTETMTTIQLREMINEARTAFGEVKVRNDQLLARIEDELEDELGVCKTIAHPQSGVQMRYYDLTLEQCTLVGMRESKGVRRSVLAKLKELEAQQVPAIPKTYAAALLEAGRLAQINEEQAAKLAEAAPKVEYVDRYVEATSGSKGFRQVCKLLGAKEPEFRQFLSDKKIMYRLGGEWMPFAYHVEAGRFEVKTGVANDHAYNTAKFTAKGVTWVAGEWAKHQVEALV